MRIWFETVERNPGHSRIFDGDVECHIRLEGRGEDIVFHTCCEDKGMQEVMIDLLNIGLRNAIEEGNLVQGYFSHRVVQEDPRTEAEDDDQDSDEGPETHREGGGSHWPLQGDDPVQDTDGEEVDSIGEDEGEEQVVHADEEDPTEV